MCRCTLCIYKSGIKCVDVHFVFIRYRTFNMSKSRRLLDCLCYFSLTFTFQLKWIIAGVFSYPMLYWKLHKRAKWENLSYSGCLDLHRKPREAQILVLVARCEFKKWQTAALEILRREKNRNRVYDRFMRWTNFIYGNHGITL